MEFDLELDRVISKIKDSKAKLVCLQLPDGLKPKAMDIQMQIENNTNAQVIIWAGSCYGSCDVPTSLDKLGIDLLVHWGHSEWQ